MSRPALPDPIVRYHKRIRWVWVGLALQPIAFLVIGSFNELDALSWRGIVGVVLLLVSVVLVDWGLWNYAKSKGYNNWVASLSLLHLYSLLIFVFLPDRNRRTR